VIKLNIVNAIYYIGTTSCFLHFRNKSEFTKDGYLGVINDGDLTILTRSTFKDYIGEDYKEEKIKIIINQSGVKRCEFNFIRTVDNKLFNKFFKNKASKDEINKKIIDGAPNFHEKFIYKIHAKKNLTKDEIKDIINLGIKSLEYLESQKY
jgi:hypothetical protein